MNRNLIWAGLAVLLSFGLHGLGFVLGPREDPIALEGGAPQKVAMLGNSFADMAAGVVTPTTTQPDLQEPVEPTLVDPTPGPPETEAVTPPVQPTVTPPVATPPPPVAKAITPATEPVATPVAKPVVKPVPKAVVKPRPKPAPKPPKPVKQVKPTPKPKPKTAPKPTPRGNAASSSKRGQSDGQAGAKATQSGQAKGTSRQVGNAAVSNYPGKVWRKLSRTRKRGRGKGKAVVGFKISASGGVARAWIIRSSGNANLDAAAVKHVHRAAPFPRPPSGAKTQYSYDYVGK